MDREKNKSMHMDTYRVFSSAPVHKDPHPGGNHKSTSVTSPLRINPPYLPHHRILPSSHLQQRQVRVQVSEAVQDHRTAVLDHLQLHTVPNVPHPPRRLKHFDQLARLDAMRLA